MKISLILALIATALLCGCESVSERFNPTPVTQAMDANFEQTFAAATQALTELGYKIDSKKPVQGIVTASSSVSSGSLADRAQQFSIRLSLESTELGRTNVAILIEEITEDRYGSGAPLVQSRVLPDSGRHQLLFERLRAILARPAQ